jgi:hypothetical protein
LKSLPASPARDRINQTLEAVYKSRFPEDASLAGLQKILQEKEAAFGAASGPLVSSPDSPGRRAPGGLS